MRIGVDAHVLAGKYQGSRTYLSNLYREVIRKDRSNEYLFFGHWNGAEPFGKTVRYVDYKSTSRWKRLAFQARTLVRRHNVELFHSAYIAPIMLSCDSLLSVLDILFETHPRFFEKSLVVRNRLLVRYSAGKARLVHTISEFARQALIDRYKLHPEKVCLVPCGVDLERFHPDFSGDAADRVATHFGVRDYILTVGRLEPRKNHVGLIRAYSILRDKHKDLPLLVIVGNRDFGFDGLFETRQRLGLESSIKVINHVDDDMLPDLYRAAIMFVYPSFAEGFGIPVLEALASALPVITSNVTAIPEAVGDAGLLIDPTSSEQIAHAMESVLSDTGMAADLSTRGPGQARKWSWDEAARCYLAALQRLE